MSHAGLIAFFMASVFSGAALYIGLVEQPARLALDDRAMLAEWTPSDRRGLAFLAGAALLGAVSGLLAYGSDHDVRWLVGAIVILASWPYMFFVLVPVNNRLLTATAGEDGAARLFLKDWGLLEWGLPAIGLVASGCCAWALW
jgi:hypothetical protein